MEHFSDVDDFIQSRSASIIVVCKYLIQVHRQRSKQQVGLLQQIAGSEREFFKGRVISSPTQVADIRKMSSLFYDVS